MPHYEFDPDDPDAPQEIDLDDDEAETLDCPECGRAIYENAGVCPHCGCVITEMSPATQRAHGWFWPITIGILVAVMLVVWHGLGR